MILYFLHVSFHVGGLIADKELFTLLVHGLSISKHLLGVLILADMLLFAPQFLNLIYFYLYILKLTLNSSLQKDVPYSTLSASWLV